MQNYLKYCLPCLYLTIIFIVPLCIAVIFKLISTYIGFKASKYCKFNNIKFFKLIYDKGYYGEYLTFKKLEQEYPNSVIMTNIYIPHNNINTEIDLLMIHKTGIYVFESKNYSGWIFGSENDKKWTITLNRTVKNQVLNPIIQNKIHIAALMNLLILDETYFNNIIVFSDRCELKSVNVKTIVIKRNQLISLLDKVIENKDNILTEESIKEVKNQLMLYCNVTEEVKTQHIKNITEKYSSN